MDIIVWMRRHTCVTMEYPLAQSSVTVQACIVMMIVNLKDGRDGSIGGR